MIVPMHPMDLWCEHQSCGLCTLITRADGISITSLLLSDKEKCNQPKLLDLTSFYLLLSLCYASCSLFIFHKFHTRTIQCYSNLRPFRCRSSFTSPKCEPHLRNSDPLHRFNFLTSHIRSNFYTYPSLHPKNASSTSESALFLLHFSFQAWLLLSTSPPPQP